MCGIAGFLGGERFTPEEASSIARGMADTVAHRGPDDAGVWIDRAAEVALAYRRLAVIDPSPAGRQPMQSASGRSVIVFNGEIYNHLDLRRQIEAQRPNARTWRGHSDTETLLAAIECWGVEEALQAATGMFAFAFWDREERTLCLARDRMGEKPLYYGWQNGVFLFGSELKALAAHPAFEGDVDRDALALLLRHGYIASPWSIYKGVRKLPAGTYIKLVAGASPQRRIGELPEPRRYWSLREVVAAGQAQPFEGTPEDAVDTLHRLLLRAVRGQMAADVPLGAFLSGGIDSSTVVALMQAQSTRPVRSFTVGFDESGYNEAEYAKAVARHLGTDHTELYISPQDAMDVIPRLPDLFDEPFADSSQIPTFLVAGLARRHVTVALSGDGSDELFGGYGHYVSTPRRWRLLSSVPVPLRRFVAAAIMAAQAHGAGSVPDGVLGHGAMDRRLHQLQAKAHTLALLANCGTQEEFHRLSLSHWRNPSSVVLGASESETALTESMLWPDALEFAARLMAVDSLSYLPDDILVKVDRASMGVSLETRAPFLDRHVMEFVWRLPLSFKIRNARSKWILRQVLDKYVPTRLVERPKAGFSIPLASWLRGPLRDWAETLLDARRLRAEGFFDPWPVRRKWHEFLNAHSQCEQHIWSILMFQAWLDHSRRELKTKRTALATATRFHRASSSNSAT